MGLVLLYSYGKIWLLFRSVQPTVYLSKNIGLQCYQIVCKKIVPASILLSELPTDICYAQFDFFIVNPIMTQLIK